MKTKSVWFTLTVLLFAAVGCGGTAGDRVAIGGKVTLKGAPLTSGTIEFVSEDGSKQSGALIQQGAYDIAATQGLPPGTYIVRIHAADESGAPAGGEAPGPESLTTTAKEAVPPEFNVNSGIRATLTAGKKNEHNFDIP